jgi:arylsulfatase A-like enzyme
VHEGGISSPLIMHWPRGMAASRRRTWEHQPAHLIDLMATCVDVAHASYPATYRGLAITPLEGVSLKPALTGESLSRKNPIFFEHEGNRAVRDDHWKLVAKGPVGPWELYDMESDRTELHDLAADHPDRVQDMARAWEDWARRARVIPWIWKGPYAEKNLEN